MTQDGNSLVVRDYLGVKIYDVRKSSEPVSVIPIQTHLIPLVQELDTNDVLYEKFDLSLGMNDQYFVTGSFDREFFIHDLHNNKTLQLMSHRFQPRVITPLPQSINPSMVDHSAPTQLLMKYAPRDHSTNMPIDYNAKVALTRFHPNETLIATAVSNNLYVFNGYYTQS